MKLSSLGVLFVLALAPWPSYAASWTEPAMISSPLRLAGLQKIDSCDRGAATSAWVDWPRGAGQFGSPFVGQVKAAVRRGSGWSSPVTVSGREGLEATAPLVEMDARCNSIVMYGGNRSGGSTIEVVSYDSSSGNWGSPAVLAGSALLDGYGSYSLDVADSGVAAAAWLAQEADGSTTVKAARYLPALGWQQAQDVHKSSGGRVSLKVAISNSGNAVTAWSDNGKDILLAENMGAEWSDPEIVSSTEESYGPAMALDSSGALTIAWLGKRDQDDGMRSYSRRRANDGHWAEQVALGAYVFNGPTLKADGVGGVLAVWLERPHNKVVVARQAAGGGWNSPQVIGDEASAQPNIASNSDGDAVATWMTEEAEIQFSVQLEGGQWAEAEDLIEARPLFHFEPDVTLSGDRATAVWFSSRLPRARFGGVVRAADLYQR